jgi:phosphatidate cytidylyltransferase
MMTNRVITALTLLFIGIFVITCGGLIMLIWVWLLSILAAYEMFEMMSKRGHRPYRIIGYTLISAAVLGMYFDPHFLIWTHRATQIVSMIVLAGALSELIFRKIWIPRSNGLATARVVIFIIATFSFIFLLRTGTNGLMNFIFCILIVWANDTFALLGGRWIGRTQLSQISPKKTIEGSLVGLGVGVAVSWTYMLILNTFWHIHLGVMFYSLLAIGLGIISQVGDLHESLVKRHFGVKDSSNILPGHGGIYDRADSTLFVAPFAFYLFN